jgi:hypothetical protein
LFYSSLPPLNLIIVGPMGHGKSTLGNKLLNENHFDNGRSPTRITEYVHIASSSQFQVADCVGFGDVKDDRAFINSFVDKKNIICDYAPVKAILFVIKFNNKESNSFLDSAKEFWKYFGTRSLGSVVLVCIQGGNIKYSNSNFENILLNSDGYRFLKDKYKIDIPFVLWDSIFEYPGQMNKLMQNIRSRNAFCREAVEDMFDSFERFNN